MIREYTGSNFTNSCYTYNQNDFNPVEQFDKKNYLECLHQIVFLIGYHCDEKYCKLSLADDGIIHELIHLSIGIEVCSHSSTEFIRQEIMKIEKRL